MAARDGGPLMWQGEDISANGDLFNALCAMQTEAEADEFWPVYIAWLSQPEAALNGSTPEQVAANNIGYLMGYSNDREERQRVYGLFAKYNAVHPVLGRTF